MEGNAIVNLVLYTHALKIVLSGPFTCEPNTVRFVTKSCPYNNLIMNSRKYTIAFSPRFPLNLFQIQGRTHRYLCSVNNTTFPPYFLLSSFSLFLRPPPFSFFFPSLFLGSSFSLYTSLCAPSSPHTCKLGSEDFFLSHLAPPGTSYGQL